MVFFFFQAEDGIRDIGVTGVQTCALPICVVGPGEDPATTAARELAEELGVTGVPLAPLFTVVYDEGEGGLRSHLFAFEARYDGAVRHQPEEVADGGWMPLAELRARLADPSWPFVPDGRVLVERWFARQRAAGGG